MKTSISYKKFSFHFFALIMLILCISGCSQETEDDYCDTLWIVTEQSTSDGMNYQLENAAESFAGIYPDITLRIDILPTNEAEREVYLEQLRSQIMAGEGPDVYLLPTGNLLKVDSRTKRSQRLLTTQLEVEPLFSDVTQAMYGGVFADIGSYYDMDTDLNTDALQQDVMGAGVIDGCRYVLPLRYTMPILLTDPSNYENSGITQELLDSGITVLTEYVLDTGDAMMAAGLRLPDDTTLLHQLYDYENGEMAITQEEIADYMRLYQQWYALSQTAVEQYINGLLDELWVVLDEATHHSFEDPLAAAEVEITLDSFNDVYDYGRYGYHWSLNGFLLFSDSLTGALDQTAISKVIEKELEVQPMRNTDGKVVAEVVYYGAVGSSCNDPKLAYEFLRLFLTEDYQWDLVRPRASRENYNSSNLPQEKQVDGLVEDSWPVRTNGSVQYLWDTLQYQNFHESYIYENYHKDLKSDDLNISNDDMTILDITIDEVRFPISQTYEESLSYALSLLSNEDGTPTDVDIEELAEQIYQYLQWHLEEG